ncbi:MAG: choice-of-anchor P family protein [Acidimicrobiales bacterium]
MAVEEHLYAAGWEIERVVPRFIPYSFRRPSSWSSGSRGKVIVASGTVDANAHIFVDLGHLGYASVLLNERSVTTMGGTDTEGTVNAIHVRLYTLGGLLTGEVIVASFTDDETAI